METKILRKRDCLHMGYQSFYLQVLAKRLYEDKGYYLIERYAKIPSKFKSFPQTKLLTEDKLLETKVKNQSQKIFLSFHILLFLTGAIVHIIILEQG